MKMYIALVPWLVFTSAVLAQTVPPALMVTSEGRSVPLGFAKLHCDVRIRACLDRWLGGTGGGPQALHVELVLVRHAAAQPKRTDLTRAELAKWIAELENVAYDGGTQLGAIGPLPGGPKPDFHLLFTDGISNFSREEPAPLDAPTYIFSADAGANHSWLHSLAITTSGQYFNLARWKDGLDRHDRVLSVRYLRAGAETCETTSTGLKRQSSI